MKSISIKFKLILLVTGVSAVSLVLATALIIGNDLRAFKTSMVHDFTILAKITAANSQAAVFFNDDQSASESLAALQANENVVATCIYTNEKEVFASYLRKGETFENPEICNPEHANISDYFHENHPHITEPIMINGKILRLCYIMSDLNRLYDRLAMYVVVAGPAVAFSLLVAILLSSLFQRRILRPIFHPLETMASVARGREDYSLRAKKIGNDELGRLTDSFNTMLSEIEKRDRKLAKHK